MAIEPLFLDEDPRFTKNTYDRDIDQVLFPGSDPFAPDEYDPNNAEITHDEDTNYFLTLNLLACYAKVPVFTALLCDGGDGEATLLSLTINLSARLIQGVKATGAGRCTDRTQHYWL